MSLGILGGGCAGGGEEGNSSGVPCVPEVEACDGFDNDCDGQIDEDCDCKPGETRACYSGPEATKGIGICSDGTQTCSELGKWGECAGEVLPIEPAEAEMMLCDGLDNDCTGMIDEGCACTPPVASTTQPCYTGPEGTEGIGECIGGEQSCKPDGTWDTKCKGEVKPKDEVCDSLDNDCNGEIDDMGMTTCGVGECQVSVVTCTDGELTPCVALPPTKEVCDNKDNDCDQLTDETDPDNGLPCDSGQPGVCAAGQLECQSGTMVCVSSKLSAPEKCDGLDNDCDDVTDEDNPGGGGACDSGQPGICQAGTYNCVNGTIQCTPNAQAATEVCNGVDDNCNGMIDDGNPGGGAVCSTGLSGACAAGTKNCVNGTIQCTPNVMPQPEMCNGQDDDCDGLTDDGNPGGGAVCNTGLLGVCAAGTITCQGGQLSCKQNVQAATEICGNGLDDNCDGQPDPMVTVYFNEAFDDNSQGWTLGTQWQIAPAAASSGQNYGYADPAQDHTPTGNNGVAGVVIGGNASTAVHSYYYLTSPVVNLTSATTVYLEYWRWLNSDYAPFMVNTVEVYNGTSWVVLFQSGTSPGVQDNVWKKLSHDVTAYKNAAFQFRFGFSVASGAFVVSQWNLDDIQLVSAQCQ